MNRAVALTLALAALAAGALSAQAQERRRGSPDPAITLYEQPDFQGRSISFYYDVPNLADHGFNDRARSARVGGSWRLCEDKNYRSRCEPFADDVRDFGPYGFNAQVSSLQQVAGRIGRPGFEGPAYGGVGGQRPVAGRDGVEGRSVVFFRRPSLNGLDVVARGRESADAFCRTVGLASSAYFDERERAREAVDESGRVVGASPVLRDVLCRR